MFGDLIIEPTEYIEETDNEYLSYLNDKYKNNGIIFKNFDLEYCRNFILNAIIDLIATSVAEMKPVLEEKNDFWRRIKAPNLYQTWKQFIFELTANYLLDGIAYIYLILDENNNISQIRNYKRSEVIEHNLNMKNDYITNYDIYKYNTIIQVKNYNDKFYDERNQVIRWKSYNSMYSFFDKLPIEKIRAGKGLLEYIKNVEIFTNNFFQNNKPGYVLSCKADNGINNNLTEETKNQLRKDFYDKNNFSKLLIMDNGWSLDLIGSDIDKINFADSLRSYASFLCSLFRVPPELLYLISSSNGQYKSNEETRLHFYYSRIIPLMEEICELFNRFILFRYGKDKLGFNATKIAVVEKDRLNIAKIRTELGIEKVNELREAINLEPVEDGENVMVSKNYGTLKNIVLGDGMSNMKNLDK